MDYKNLIEQLRNAFPGSEYELERSLCESISTAIETLLAEQRDSRLTPKMVSCPGGWEGTRLTRYYCPQCKKAVRNDEAYCHKCGQAILFPKEEYDKENNKIWLNFEQEQWRGPQKGESDD